MGQIILLKKSNIEQLSKFMDTQNPTEPIAAMGSNKIIIGAIVVLVVLVGGYFYFNKPQQALGEPIKIGLSSPMTGEAAGYGEGFYGGAALAVKEINDAGGINGRQIKLVVEDDQCNSTTGVSAMNKLVTSDKVSVIVGPMCSAVAGASAPVAQTGEVPTLLTASAPNLTKAGDYIFRNYPSDFLQGKFAAEFTYSTLNKKKAAIIYVKNDWGQGLNDVFTQRFKELGGDVVYSEGIIQTSTDLRTQLAKAKAANPDVLYFIVYPQNSIAGLKQIKTMAFNVPIVGGDAFFDNNLIALPEAEGIMFTNGQINNPTEFQDKIKQATGKNANGFSPYAYDAVRIFAQVIKNVGTDQKAIKDALVRLNFKDSMAVSSVEFDADRELKVMKFDVLVIKNGKTVEYTQ